MTVLHCAYRSTGKQQYHDCHVCRTPEGKLNRLETRVALSLTIPLPLLRHADEVIE
jgi:hypothetical protein